MSACLKNLPLRDLTASIYLSEAPSPPRFWVVQQFCRFGIWSNTQCMTPVYALHITPTPPPSVTHCTEWIDLYLFTQGRGGGKVNWREGRVAPVHKRGRKYQHD